MREKVPRRGVIATVRCVVRPRRLRYRTRGRPCFHKNCGWSSAPGNSAHDAPRVPPAHRAAPLAMSAHLPDEELPALARQEAKLTHWDPLAGNVSAAVVLLCRALVRGEEWDTCLLKAGKYCDVLNQGSWQGRAVPPISRSGLAPEVPRAAVLFVGTSPDLETALARSGEFAGPANYCPVLVGAIGGARWGASRIPQAWLKRGAILQRVESVADALAAPWRRGPGQPV